MSCLLDTCVIPELVRKEPNSHVVAWLDTLDATRVYLSVLTLGEIQKGITKLPDSRCQRDLKVWLEHNLLRRFAGRILPLNDSVMLRWGTLVGNLDRAGIPLSLIDALMAVVALHHDLLLVTRNESDFQHAGLVIENPWPQ